MSTPTQPHEAKNCDCHGWASHGYVRVARAVYACARCRGDCTMELIYAVDAGVETKCLPDYLPDPKQP